MCGTESVLLLLLLTMVATIRAADIVLLRAVHGVHAHRDDIGCAYDEHAAEHAPLFAPEPLLEKLVLPAALWCDTSARNATHAAHCHDRTTARRYVARTLVCDDRGRESVRCVARFECATLIDEFRAGVATTLVCVTLLILGRALCVTDSRATRLDYVRDTSL